MTDFAIAHVAGGETHVLADACAQQLRDMDGHNLGFVYVTDALVDGLDDIVAILKVRTGISDWVGTVGLGICATGTVYFDKPAIVALTGRFADDAHRMIPTLEGPSEVAATVDAGFQALLGIVHGDPRNAHTAEIVASLAREHQTFLVGGLSSAERAFRQVAGTIVDGGVSGVLLGSELEVAVGLTQGCAPIGPSHEVTRGDGNILVALDDRPAFEVMCEDLGVADGVDPRPWLADIHAALPISGSDIGDYLVRNLMGIEQSQGLVGIAGDITIGDRVMFVRRDRESASKDLQRMLGDLQSRLTGPPKAGLYFSCVARGPSLFTDEAHELKAIQEVFGEIPIAGFFGNGEISHDRVYGYTGVLALFV